MGKKREDMVIFSKIRAAYDFLSPRERQIADYMMDHPEEAAVGTALSVAQAAGTSNATVVRFCRSCGFSGWSELKLYLNREILSSDSLKGQSIQQDDSVSVVKQKVKGYHDAILSEMVANWDEEVYEQAAEALLRAHRVLIDGVGGSQSTAYTMLDIFLTLDIRCEYYSDPVLSTMKVAMMEPGDVLLVIMHTGRFRTVLEDMKLARKKGLIVILLCGTPGSAAIEYADILLIPSFNRRDYSLDAISVRVAELMIVEVLYTLMLMKKNRLGEGKLELDDYLEVHRCESRLKPAASSK